MRRKGHALRKRYGRSHTAARHLAEESLRVAHDNPTIKSVNLAARLYEEASRRASAEGHHDDAARLWRTYNDVTAVRTFPIGNETAEDAREQALAALSTIMQREHYSGGWS